MEGVILGAILTAIGATASAIAFIAYKHHKEYPRIAGLLTAIIISICILIVSYDFIAMIITHVIISYLIQANVDANIRNGVTAASEAIRPNTNIIFVFWVISVGYIQILKALPFFNIVGQPELDSKSQE